MVAMSGAAKMEHLLRSFSLGSRTKPLMAATTMAAAPVSPREMDLNCALATSSVLFSAAAWHCSRSTSRCVAMTAEMPSVWAGVVLARWKPSTASCTASRARCSGYMSITPGRAFLHPGLNSAT